MWMTTFFVLLQYDSMQLCTYAGKLGVSWQDYAVMQLCSSAIQQLRIFLVQPLPISFSINQNWDFSLT